MTFLLLALLSFLPAWAGDYYVDSYYEDGITLLARYTWFQDDQGRRFLLQSTLFHRNGQKQEEGGYLVFQREGLWQRWYDTGQREQEVHYSANLREGLLKQWHTNGVHSAEFSYVHDRLEGAYKAWHDNGALRADGAYVNDLAEGQWSYYHANGQLAERGLFHEGQRADGIWTWWCAAGGKEEEGAYRNGQKDGLWLLWYRRGDPQTEGFLWEESNYANGILLNKTVYFYHPQYPGEDAPGTLSQKSVFTYSGSDVFELKKRYNGAQWGDNMGAVWWEENIKNNNRHGWTREWKQNHPHPSRAWSEEYYENGVRRLSYLWYENGNKEKEIHYDEAGLMHGFCGQWTYLGAPEAFGYYEHGYAQGYWQSWYLKKIYDDTGKLQRHDESYWSGMMYSGARVGSWFFRSYSGWRDFPTLKWIEYRDSHYTDYGGAQFVPPAYTPPASDKRSVRGLVSEAESGRGIQGATVSGGGVTVATDGNGYYLIEVTAAVFTEPVSLIASKDGYLAAMQTADLNQLHCSTINFGLPFRGTLPQPAITSVKSKWGTFFLEGVPVPNVYTVAVNWNGATPGSLLVNVNGQETARPATAAGGTFTVDMGADLIPSVDPNRNYIFVKALSAEGVQSPIHRLRPVCAPSPSWLSPMSWAFTFMAAGGDRKPAFTLTGSYPEPPLAFKLKDHLPTWAWEKWEKFPYIGGDFDMDTRFVLASEYKTDNTGSVQVGGQMGVKIASVDVQGKVKGVAKLSNKPGQGLQWTASEVNAVVEGRIKKKISLLELVPPAAAAAQLPVIGWVITYCTENVESKAYFTVAGGATFGMASTNNFPWVSTLKPEFVLGTGLALSSKPFPGVEAELTGGGTIKVVGMLYPTRQLEKMEASLLAKLAVVIRGHKREFEGKHTFTYPFPEGFSQVNGLSLSDSSPLAFTPIPRDFLSHPNYARFLPERPLVHSADVSIQASGTLPQGQRLIENVFPYAQPTLAVRPDGMAVIVYVHFDPNDATVQATEIAAVSYDGVSYKAPVLAMNDTRAEYSPSAAFDANGRLVCVWERVKDENFAGQDLVDMAPLLEIVTATFDPGTSAWSAPVALTDNGYIDHSPILRRGPDGSLFLVWQSHETNELIGTTNNPSFLHGARWNATTGLFGTVTTAPSGLADVVGLDMAFNGTEALVVFARDMDGDHGTSDDVDLFVQRETVAGWSAIERLTDGALPDRNPRVLYRSSTAPELLWLKGTTVVRMTDWLTGATESVRTNTESFSSADFRVTCDAQGNLVMVWQDVDAAGPDLFYRIHDATRGVWSDDLRMTGDACLEKVADCAMGPSGALHLAYATKDLTSNTTDLIHTLHQLRADLAVETVTLSPEQPDAGETVSVSCRVRNTGDWAVEGAVVSFYLGDPLDNGVLLGSAPLSPTLLRAGTTADAVLQWTTPTNPQPAKLVAIVDFDNAVKESDETNNTGQSSLFKPDLHVVSVRYEERPDGQVDLIATIRNSGGSASSAFRVGFRVDGNDMGSSGLPGLMAGADAEALLQAWSMISFTRRPSEVEAVADIVGEIVESDESNNRGRTEVLLSADVDGDDIPDQWEMAIFGDLSPNAHSNRDGDGALDSVEWRVGTDPLDPASCFACMIGNPDQTGIVTVSWAAEPGMTYQAQFHERLTSGEWTNLGEPVTVSSGMTTASQTDHPPVGAIQRFYRARIVTPP